MRSPTLTLGGAGEKKLRGQKFTVGALHAETSLAEKMSFTKSALDHI